MRRAQALAGGEGYRLGCCAYEIISMPPRPTVQRLPRCFWPAPAFLAAICRRQRSTLWSCAARDSLQILLGQIPSHSCTPTPASPKHNRRLSPRQSWQSGTCHKLANQATRRFVLSLDWLLPSWHIIWISPTCKLPGGTRDGCPLLLP